MDGFEDLFDFLKTGPLVKKYPNYSKYPRLIQDCLQLNERIQAIGKAA